MLTTTKFDESTPLHEIEVGVRALGIIARVDYEHASEQIRRIELASPGHTASKQSESVSRSIPKSSLKARSFLSSPSPLPEVQAETPPRARVASPEDAEIPPPPLAHEVRRDLRGAPPGTVAAACARLEGCQPGLQGAAASFPRPSSAPDLGAEIVQALRGRRPKPAAEGCCSHCTCCSDRNHCR